MTDMPPSRFRVVERGRRLEVIDTQAGKTPPARQTEAPRPMSRPDKRRLQLPEKLRFDGGGSWTTDSFYDVKGPRTLVLDGRAMRKLRYAGMALVVLIVAWAVAGTFVPILWGAPFLLITPKVRERVRIQATLWLDALDSAE